MNADVEQLRAEFQQLKAQFHQERRRFRVQTGLALCAVIGAILASPANRAAIAQGYGVTLAQLATRMTAVENKTQFMSASSANKTTTFTGCNVLIQSGS